MLTKLGASRLLLVGPWAWPALVFEALDLIHKMWRTP